MKMDTPASFGEATPRRSVPTPRAHSASASAADRALVSTMQRLLKQSQDLVASLAALDKERARLSAELDRTQADVSTVLAELAKRRPPATPRM